MHHDAAAGIVHLADQRHGEGVHFHQLSTQNHPGNVVFLSLLQIMNTISRERHMSEPCAESLQAIMRRKSLHNHTVGKGNLLLQQLKVLHLIGHQHHFRVCLE